MIDLLTPPPERDLPPTRGAEIRRTVLRSAGATRRRRRGLVVRLAVPTLAVLVVLGAVLGLRGGEAPAVLASPSPAPASRSVEDGTVDTDAGPLDESEAASLVAKRLAGRRGPSQPALASVVLARRTTTPLGDGTFVVWVDTAGSTWWSEDVPGLMGSQGPVSGPAARTIRVPDAAHPVVRLSDLRFSWREDEDRPDATARDLASGTVYLVAPSVERVEVRMTVEGVPGPWFSAPAHEGYVYVPAVTPGPHSTSDHIDEVTELEDRAFGADGTPLPVVQR